MSTGFREGQEVRVVSSPPSGERPDLTGETAAVAVVFPSPDGTLLYGLPIGPEEPRAKDGFLGLWWYDDDELEAVEASAAA